MVLGATRAQTFWRVILPSLFPALVTGFALAFARALGEYGSVVFISGNMPMRTEIAPVHQSFDSLMQTAVCIMHSQNLVARTSVRGRPD
jgi:ABC-type sulfate transport system permease component